MAAGAQWRDKASGFFSLSGMRLKHATQTASIFVGDVAKDAGTGVAEVAELAAEVAERASIAMKQQWALLQQTRQQQQRQSQYSFSSSERVQDRFKSAAASTSVLVKRSLMETRDKVAVGKTRLEQAAKCVAERSRIMLERWQKGQTCMNVFGVAIEDVVQQQRSTKPVPQVILSCSDYLVQSGLSSENIFKASGDPHTVQRLRCIFEGDLNARIPEGTNPIDVAALIKMYLRMLPEPLLTFSLYDGIKKARGNARQLSILVGTIPYVNYSTLECLICLLLRVKQKSALNKMDAYNLAVELAPCLLWKQASSLTSNGHRLSNGLTMNDSWENDADIKGVDSVIPLDDEPAVADFAIIEAVQCFIEHQKLIFAEPAEALWH